MKQTFNFEFFCNGLINYIYFLKGLLLIMHVIGGRPVFVINLLKRVILISLLSIIHSVVLKVCRTRVHEGLANAHLHQLLFSKISFINRIAILNLFFCNYFFLFLPESFMRCNWRTFNIAWIKFIYLKFYCDVWTIQLYDCH